MDENIINIPFVAHEAAMNRMERANKREFVRNYLDRTYKRLYNVKGSVGEVSGMFPNSTLLITMRGHITCSKNGVIYDTFDCRNEKTESVWLVK